MYDDILLTLKYFIPDLWVVSIFFAAVWFLGVVVFLVFCLFMKRPIGGWRRAVWLLVMPGMALLGITLFLMALIALLSFLPGWHNDTLYLPL